MLIIGIRNQGVWTLGPESRTLRVAAVQMESKNGQIEANLEHALPFVDDAAGQGARFILLPEFLATGYIFTKAIWEGASREKGRQSGG